MSEAEFFVDLALILFIVEDARWLLLGLLSDSDLFQQILEFTIHLNLIRKFHTIHVLRS